MDVFEAIKKRRSIRSYEDKPIEEDKLKKVLEAGRLAPSAANRQEWKFVIVKDRFLKKKIAAAANKQNFISQAGAIIVGCGTECFNVMTCGQYAYTVDVSIAMTQMSLQAVEEGLGTCWIGAFKEDEVKKILNLPDEVRVVELMTLGYPAYVPEPTLRKKLDEVVSYDGWG
ncbi:MAG: nitroreductase [candidate division Zixibacteria bacterium SM23_73_2]|nr:MAG: nitroreductase [candidate division Zixibacteria bacterium SM23_73_2]